MHTVHIQLMHMAHIQLTHTHSLHTQSLRTQLTHYTRAHLHTAHTLHTCTRTHSSHVTHVHTHTQLTHTCTQSSSLRSARDHYVVHGSHARVPGQAADLVPRCPVCWAPHETAEPRGLRHEGGQGRCQGPGREEVGAAGRCARSSVRLPTGTELSSSRPSPRLAMPGTWRLVEETTQNSAHSGKMPPSLGRGRAPGRGRWAATPLCTGHPEFTGTPPGPAGTRAPSTGRSHGGRVPIPRVPCHPPPSERVPRAR